MKNCLLLHLLTTASSSRMNVINEADSVTHSSNDASAAEDKNAEEDENDYYYYRDDIETGDEPELSSLAN